MKNVVVVYKSPKQEGTQYTRVEANGFGVDVARTAKAAYTVPVGVALKK